MIYLFSLALKNNTTYFIIRLLACFAYELYPSFESRYVVVLFDNAGVSCTLFSVTLFAHLLYS